MKVNLQIRNDDTHEYDFETTIDLPSIPRKGELFIYQGKQGQKLVYDVKEVIYSVESIEILLATHCSLTDYFNRNGVKFS